MSRRLLHASVLALLLHGAVQAAPPVSFRLDGAGTDNCTVFLVGFDGTTPEAMRLTTGRLQWFTASAMARSSARCLSFTPTPR